MCAYIKRMLILALSALIVCCIPVQGSASGRMLQPVPSVRSPHAITAMTLDATLVGGRVVAVGDHGVVELSDDEGLTFHQARSVPVSTMLNAVSFSDKQSGWAVGNWGVILHTQDAGETWVIQRIAVDEDQPLFSVHFFNANEGVAVGLWSLVLLTTDGGKTWQKQVLAPPPGATKADLNLFSLFVDRSNTLYAAAERGMLLRSEDHGRTWSYLSTGYRGSFWTGVALSDGTLLLAGLRGTIYRSTDKGAHWESVSTGSKSSVTHLTESNGRILAVGLDGLQMMSTNAGAGFTVAANAVRQSLTTALFTSAGHPLLFSTTGPLPLTAHWQPE